MRFSCAQPDGGGRLAGGGELRERPVESVTKRLLTRIDRELRAALALALESLDAASAEAIAALLGERVKPDVADAAFRKRVSRAYAKLRVLLGGHGER